MNQPADRLLAAYGPPESKRLHLVDFENLIGAGMYSSDYAFQTCEGYIRATNACLGDTFVIAAGPQNRQATIAGWHVGAPLYMFRTGKDGADLALIDLAASLREVEKFNHVFVGSGDGALALVADHLARKGVPFTVVVGKGGLSPKFKGYPTVKIGVSKNVSAY